MDPFSSLNGFFQIAIITKEFKATVTTESDQRTAVLVEEVCHGPENHE